MSQTRKISEILILKMSFESGKDFTYQFLTALEKNLKKKDFVEPLIRKIIHFFI